MKPKLYVENMALSIIQPLNSTTQICIIQDWVNPFLFKRINNYKIRIYTAKQRLKYYKGQQITEMDYV